MKYDLNLLPTKDRRGLGPKRFLYFLAILILVLLFGYYGIYFPYATKGTLEKRFQAMENDVNTLRIKAERYTAASEELIENTDRIAVLQEAMKGQPRFSDLFATLEKTIPKDIIIKELRADAESVTLLGQAPNYTDVAQFIVRLRNEDYPVKVNFSGAQMHEGSQLADIPDGKMHEFTIHIISKLDEEDIDDEPDESQETENTGDNEAENS
ncbi:MAG: PilN domain-containing protein [Clostridiales bacterium]|nr:PilN domain-containing protein [Clostridiales bacterium]